MEFQFLSPKPPEHLSEMAQASIQVAAIAGRLAVEQRAVVHNIDGRPENVAEHSNMLAIVAPMLAAEFFPQIDADRVARYAPIHDLLEAYVGDTPTHIITSEGLVAKAEREHAAFEQIKLDYANLPSFVRTVTEYEAQEITEARFVRIVDKLMPLLVHINEKYVSLSRTDYTAAAIRQNSAERASSYLQDYPDMKSLIELRVELADYVADQLEA